ncbi:hypothetical protein ACFQ1I_39325 [Kitasatospora arboriphila]
MRGDLAERQCRTETSIMLSSTRRATSSPQPSTAIASARVNSGRGS